MALAVERELVATYPEIDFFTEEKAGIDLETLEVELLTRVDELSQSQPLDLMAINELIDMIGDFINHRSAEVLAAANMALIKLTFCCIEVPSVILWKRWRDGYLNSF